MSDLQQQEAEAAQAQQPQSAPEPEQATPEEHADEAQASLASRLFSGEAGGCASPAMSGLTARLRTSAAFHQRLLSLLSHKGLDAPGVVLVFCEVFSGSSISMHG